MHRRGWLIVGVVASLLVAAVGWWRGGEPAPRVETASASTSASMSRSASPLTTTSTTTPSTTTTSPPTTTAPTTTILPTTVAAADADPRATEPPTTMPPAPLPPVAPGNGSHVLMVGDSVMLGAATALESLPGWDVAVDARVSRQVGPPYANNGIDAIRSDHQPGVDARVVIHLGTNGLFSDSQLDQIMQVLADVPRVVLLTVRIPNYPDIEAANNEMIRGAPSRYPQLVVVDWKAQSDAHPEWLGSDGIHLTGEGQQAYASLVGAAL